MADQTFLKPGYNTFDLNLLLAVNGMELVRRTLVALCPVNQTNNSLPDKSVDAINRASGGKPVIISGPNNSLRVKYISKTTAILYGKSAVPASNGKPSVKPHEIDITTIRICCASRPLRQRPE